MFDPKPTIAQLHRLNDAGTKLAIDDFGTAKSASPIPDFIDRVNER